jgi:peptidoglycan/LPS O-acetylase OafA/YrhL
MGASDRRFAYQPALDGVRALAVTAVLLFHADVAGFGGGYVGVSVFFTLSGFLITSLLIGEHRRSGRIDAAGFYARRVRRLIPASAACLLAVIVLANLGAWDQVAHLRRDLWAAALQVFNWLRLSGSTSYGDLFSQSAGQVSPVEHYWSLAIEEQFYWVWPLAFAGLASLAVRSGRSLVAVLAVPTALAIVAAPLIAVAWGPEAAYWSTFARVGEILTGALAAAVVADRGAPRWTRHGAVPALVLIATVPCAARCRSGRSWRSGSSATACTCTTGRSSRWSTRLASGAAAPRCSPPASGSPSPSRWPPTSCSSGRCGAAPGRLGPRSWPGPSPRRSSSWQRSRCRTARW